MAIKVKHEGSAASRMAASAAGGAAKRAMEAAALAKPSQIQTLQPAHASAPGISAPHAPLISAPSGGAHAPLIGGGGGIGATARLGGGGGRGGGSAASRVAGSGGGDSGDYKITGRDRNHRPDEESEWVWDNGGIGSTGKWMRKWLPGEKEAEAQQRIGDVKNRQMEELFDYKLTQQQKQELQQINDALEGARKSGRYTDEEMAELARQADSRRMGIKPLPVPKTEPDKPNIQTDDAGRSWIQTGRGWERVEGAQNAADVYAGTHLDEDGRRWGVNGRGELYEVGGGKGSAETEKQRRAYILEAVDNAKSSSKEPLTNEQISKIGEEAAATWDSLFGAKKPQGAATDAGTAGMDPVLAMRMANPLLAGMGTFADPTQQTPAEPTPTAEGAQTPAKTPPAQNPGKAAPTEEEDEFAAFKRK